MQKAIIIISVLFLVGCQNQSEEKDKKDILRIADSLKKDKYNIIGSFRELPLTFFLFFRIVLFF